MLTLSHSVTLEELIDGCQREKRDCQRLLYERYYSLMLSVCMRYVPHEEMAREVLNMGFMKVFTGIRRRSYESGNFGGWVYRIMVHTATDYLKSEIRHRHVEIDKTVYVVDDNEDALDRISAEELIEMVQQLSPAYRAVFNLYVMEEYTHPEIAEALGISEGSSKSNLSKARMRLQEMIKEREQVNRRSYAK